MSKITSRAKAALIVAVFGVLGLVGRADALLQIRFDGGAAISDNGAGDFNATVGVLTANYSNGAFTVVVSVAQSQPILSNAMTLSTTLTASGVAGNLIIEITDTNFPGPGGFLSASEGGNLPTNVSQQWSAFANSSNTAFCGAGVAVNLGTVTGTNGASGSTSGAFTNPFCLTGKLTLVSTGGNAQSGGSSDVGIKVPEPSAMLLLGSGLLGLVGWIRRRKED